jgi:hypothetical protein
VAGGVGGGWAARYREAVTEQGLAAKLEKVIERLSLDAPEHGAGRART